MWPLVVSAALAADLRVDPLVDGVVTGVGGAAWIVGEMGPFGPKRCRWCDGRDEDRLNGLDRAFRDALVSKSPSRPDSASDWMAFGVMPGFAFGLTAIAVDADHVRSKGDDLGENTLLLAQTAAIAADVTLLLKLTAARERPFVHRLAPDDKPLTRHAGENNVSFFSGHTTLAFSLAVGAGTIVSLRGYSMAPYVWALGLSGATAVGCLRMAADQHYFTDVLVGAIVGSAVGVAVPMAHRVPEGEALQDNAAKVPMMRLSGRW